MSSYQSVIGLEVHTQLSVQTKMFCNCPLSFSEKPNTLVCPICLGFPGTLPVPNQQAIQFGIKLGLATQCDINPKAMWTRKNYFYPDLPKGYQITQQGDNPLYDHPICKNGKIEILVDNQIKNIGLTRIHLEEDAGKLIHDSNGKYSLFDANRCGTPLLEIVSEPDLRSATEVITYLNKLKQIIEYLDISDANMEKGNFRCDVNISLRRNENKPLGSKVEMKNMNSFHNIEKAIEAEIINQTLILNRGEKIPQVTKRYDVNRNQTVTMRSKEQAQDYRYFPEPDLFPLECVTSDVIENVKKSLPEFPQEKKERYQQQYKLSEYDIEILTSKKEIAHYFEKVCNSISDYKLVSNWVQGHVLSIVNEQQTTINQITMTPSRLIELLKMLIKGELSGRLAKDLFQIMLTEKQSAQELANKYNLKIIKDNSLLQSLVKEVIQNNPNQVTKYLSGKKKVFGFFVGQVLKQTKGKADPSVVNSLLKEALNK